MRGWLMLFGSGLKGAGQNGRLMFDFHEWDH
jgi:hypothetical protein